MRILLAEDGYDNREFVRDVLRRAGAEVEYVENGRRAVAEAEAKTFDVILMDMNMPEMDGYEATRLLRSRGYARPILALTANAMSDDSDRCKEAGCNEHLAKPIDRARLIRSLDRLRRREDDCRRATPPDRRRRLLPRSPMPRIGGTPIAQLRRANRRLPRRRRGDGLGLQRRPGDGDDPRRIHRASQWPSRRDAASLRRRPA